MEQEKPFNTQSDVIARISQLQDMIDAELEKPEQEINMSVIDAYFKEIRELDGGVYEKSEEEIAQELQRIYQKSKPAKKKPCLKYLNTVGKRVAAVAITVGMLCGLSVGVYAAKTPITEFFLNAKDTFIEVLFDPEAAEKAPNTIQVAYKPGYVPDGYELIDETFNQKAVESKWSNAAGNTIEFTQLCIDITQLMDNENIVAQVVYIDGIKVFICERSGQTTVLWNNDHYSFMLVLCAPISDQECYSIITSLQEYDK